MKPRFEPRDENFTEMLQKANELADKVEKARSSYPEYTQKEGSKQGQERFMTQSAGKDNVQSAAYTTNNSLIESEDVKNAGASSEKSNILDKPTQFPDAYDSQIKYRLNEKGGEGPVLKSAGGNIQKYQDQQIRKSLGNLSRRLN